MTIKLEVGKKYIIPAGKYNPYIFVCDKNQYGFDYEDRYIFLDSSGVVAWVSAIDLVNITEYRDPFKNSIVGWTAINEGGTTSDVLINDRLFSKDASPRIYNTKNEALGRGWKIPIYGRWTFEELPEPEDE